MSLSIHSIEIVADTVHEPTLRDIAAAAADAFSVTLMDIRSSRRDRSTTLARWTAAALARRLTRKSLPVIARELHRDHTAILHGIRRTAGLLDSVATSQPVTLHDWARLAALKLRLGFPLDRARHS